MCDDTAAAVNEDPIQLAGARYGDLLADHGSRRDLESVPAAKHPDARVGRDERRDCRIAAKMCPDRGQVGVQVKHPFDPCDGVIHGPPAQSVYRDYKACVLVVVGDVERPGLIIAADCSVVGARFDLFDACDRAMGKKSQGRVPVEWRMTWPADRAVHEIRAYRFCG